MSKLIGLLTLLFSTALFTVAYAKTIEVHVNGMVCGFCGQGITKKFSARPEVKKVDVSLKDKTVKLEMEENQDLPDGEIRKILQQSGYQVETIQR